MSTIGGHFIFKSYETIDAYTVIDVNENGVLPIGETFKLTMIERPKAAYIWCSGKLKIGSAAFRATHRNLSDRAVKEPINISNCLLA